jgi:glutathione S-transferase
VIRLYVIPGSVASIAAELMLKRNGIEYRRRDLIPGVHMPIVRLLGFPDRTVPALKCDSRKVQGSRPIARFLDELKPEPSLFPTDPERRGRRGGRALGGSGAAVGAAQARLVRLEARPLDR